MFTKFRVQNFMCLENVCVELEPVTVFIGPNSSGKSALFKALVTFCKLLRYPVRGGQYGDFNVEPGVGLDEAVWNRNSGLPITFEVWTDGNQSADPDYTMELRRTYAGWSVAREKFLFQGTWLDTGTQGFQFDTSKEHVSWPGPYKASLFYLAGANYFTQDSVAGPYLKPLQDLRNRLGQARRYRPSASDIALHVLTSRGTAQKNRSPEVDESGRGLAAALQDMLGSDRKNFVAIEQMLGEMHGHVTGLKLKSGFQGIGLFYETSRAGEDTPASLESDGVLLSTFLLWRLYSAPASLKLCVEEPENGVHLSGLKERYQLLKKFAARAEPPGPQILVATHSRDFLNAIGSRNDIMKEVRVVEFGPSVGTDICALSHYREIDQLLQEFKYQLGDLWWSGRLQHKDRF